jgi:hypothetical protein
MDPVACVHLPYPLFWPFIFLSTVAGEWRDFVVLWAAAFFYFIPFCGDIEASTRGFIEQKRVL